MEFKILCVMTVLNIAMLFANIWMRFDLENTLEEIKERTGGSEMKK